MPSCTCGLPFLKKHQRHTEELSEEKTKPVAVPAPVQHTTSTLKPTSTSTISTKLKSDTTVNGPTSTGKSEVEKAPPNNAVSPNDQNSTESSMSESGIALTGGKNPFASHKNDESPDNSSSTMSDSLKGAASGVGNTVSSGASQVSSGAQQAGSTAQDTVSSGSEKVTGASSTGTQDWEAMTEDQKKATYDALPEDKKQGMSYYEWVKQGLYHQKVNWMPWVEDMYLRWFTKDNKASYATKSAMDQSKVTGIEQVDTVQDSVNSTVSSQVGQGGLLQPVGDAVSKEGVNRAEKGTEDTSGGGSYVGAVGGGLSSAGGSVWSGAKSAGGYVGGMFGGKKQEGSTEESK